MAADTGLGSELRRLRTAAGLTQEGLAERAGLSIRAVSDTERGLRTRLYPDTTARLADALGLAGAVRERFAGVARGRSARGVLGPLPAPRTALVGRGRELEALTALLAGPGLVTVTGTGGVGKTRLALAAAGEAAASFADGVAFVQLASCHDAESAGLAIATALGANAAHGSTADVVCTAIGARRLLIVCDTFEVVPQAAPLVAEALARCANLTVLATSRSPLRLGGERLCPLGPLDAAAAALLFADRAVAARPGVDLARSGALVSDICERVQRVPLALELAAARVAHLGLADLRDRLGSQLGVLTGGSVDDDARHRTLESTVAWSYGLLDGAARAALARLALFDGWTLAAAGALLSKDPLPEVTTLVDQSLVAAPDPSDPHGRYTMLDSVREFGLARLADEGIERTVRDQHAAWFLAAAESSAGAMRRAGQRDVHEDMAADLGNLRISFRWLEDSERGEKALRLAAALWMFWLWHGGFAEGRAWIRSALAAAHDADPSLRASAHWGAGWLAYLQGDYPEARIHASSLARLAAASGSTSERRNALTLTGMVALADRRLDDAARLLGEALEAAHILAADPPASEEGRAAGQPAADGLAGHRHIAWLVAISTLNDGVGLTHTGGLPEASQRFAEARDRFAALGDETYRARALRHLAAVQVLAGEVAPARRLLEESLRTVHEAEDRFGLAETLSALAHLAAVGHDGRRAGALETRAAVVRRSLGVVQHPFDAILTERHLGPLRESAEYQAGWAEGSAPDVAAEEGLDWPEILAWP
ncbi:helix-turn-helix domain-containing protein [Sinomonas sp. ASV486]|uniref:ATP-binding protein n=1 Tax=Sinomonas sp. ASV486 TaxID=3051170 RepID=UPI0027DD7ED9|nr:helix-turn-helix domain-containing protein [Sinomonas sp. ASV486]MDQ4490175.1 helix-turn-helix domain-containing protein [Sinomonas sp. ASV486]